IALSFTVFTAYTVLLAESKAARIFLVGESTINPGEVPALIGDTRGKVSFWPLRITREPKLKPAVTPWEATTRSFKPLGGPDFLYPPQESKLRTAASPTSQARMHLFKRQAPNELKTEDLIVKSLIIADSPGKSSARHGRRARCAIPPASCILTKYMAADFLARIKKSPVLCDGAMGTLLYAKGIFINRSYDELNLSQPDLIRG